MYKELELGTLVLVAVDLSIRIQTCSCMNYTKHNPASDGYALSLREERNFTIKIFTLVSLYNIFLYLTVIKLPILYLSVIKLQILYLTVFKVQLTHPQGQNNTF